MASGCDRRTKMECKDILNLIAIVVIPLVAVLIGQYLQNRAEIRKDKMHIFKVLMTSRIYGWTVDSVHALNLIDVVFAKDKAVRAAWKELYEAYSSTEQSDLMANKRKNLMYKLLEEIANNIGYKKEITWETIQNPYIPQGMVEKWQEQAASQQAYTNILLNMQDMIPKSNKTEESNEH